MFLKSQYYISIGQRLFSNKTIDGHVQQYPNIVGIDLHNIYKFKN